MTTPNIEELMALADRYATLRIGEGTANARKELHDAMQSQAERIKELEAEIITRASYGDEQTDFAIKLAGERDALRAQLAEIDATEPSMIYHGRCVIDCGDSGHQDVTMLKMIARETKLFTRPMPPQIVGLQDVHDAVTADPTLADCAQDVNAEIEKVEPVAIALNTGTRQAVKWLQNIPHGEKLYTRPMPAQSAEHCLWARNGHEPCQHVKPAQDVTELVEALEKLARLGNGKHYENSNGNMIARMALSRYKGAK